MKNTASHYPIIRTDKISYTGINQRQFKKLKNLLKFVWSSRRSNFYKKFWDKNGFNPIHSIKSTEDITKIPLLTRELLIDTKPKDRLFISINEVDYIRATNTVGSGFLTMFSKLHYKGSIHDRSIFTIFPRNIKKIFYLRRSESCPPVFMGARLAGKLAVFGNQTDLEWSARLYHDVEPDAMVMDLPHLFAFTTQITKENKTKQVRFIQLYGRSATKLETKIIKKNYKYSTIIFTYGSNISGGAIGMQCPYLAQKNFNIYHTFPSIIYEGIPLNWSDTPEAQELVISLLEKSPTPLIRYKTGDAVEFLPPRKCRCSRNGSLIRVFGRAKRNIIRLTEENILRVEDVNNALRSLGLNYKYFIIRVKEKMIAQKPRPILHLYLYSPAKIKITEKNKKRLLALIRCSIMYKYKQDARALSLAELIKYKYLGDFRIYIRPTQKDITKNEIIDDRIF